MNAANALHKVNAARRVQQTLHKDPTNVPALLELAEMLGALKTPDLKQKRIILQRVLTLEPDNQQARQMLFEMDRAEIGGEPSRLSAAVILTSQKSLELPEKPLKLRYSLLHQMVVYPVLVFALLPMFTAFGDWDAFAFFAGFFLLLLIPLWKVSLVVELRQGEIEVSRLFGIVRTEIAWNDLNQIVSSDLRRGIKLLSQDGKRIRISPRVNGYAAIVDIVRQMRPDLFASASNLIIVPDASQPGVQVFQKHPIIRYISLFLFMMGVFALLGTVFTAQCVVIVAMVFLLWYVWKAIFLTPYRLTFDKDRLYAESWLKQNVWSADQVRDIDISATINPKYPWILRKHIAVEFTDGASFRLEGFTGGDEALYRFMQECWETYQIR